MDHLTGAYGGLLVPGVVAVVLIFIAIKVVNAIIKLVSLVLLVAVLFGGYLAWGRISSIQKAVDAALTQGQTGMTSQQALAATVGTQARQALSQTGLDPSLLRVHIVCAGANTQIQLRYADDQLPWSLLSQQWFDVPHDSRVGC